MQFQADILNTTVIRPKIIETTALGAAYLAGLAVGYWSDIHEIRQHWHKEKEFIPSRRTTENGRTERGMERCCRSGA